MKHALITASALALLGAPQFALADTSQDFADSFLPTAFVDAPELVECELSDGTTSECYKMTVDNKPDEFTIGPFCPSTTSEDGGLWNWDGDKAGLYRIDGAFLQMLDEQGFHFYDADGTVHISDPRTEQPDVDNACLQASLDDDVTMTLLIPAHPKPAAKPSQLGTVAKVGIALDGVPIFADAPSVLDTGHMPALDVCGGHIDPGGWYHWHATATDIGTALNSANVSADCALQQDATEKFAYAFDGFPIYGSRETNGSMPEGLDECGGHDEGEGYHYHASEGFPNLPTCLKGVVAENNFTTTAAGGIGSEHGGGPGAGQMPPGMEEAAETLGVDPQDLMQALGAPGQRPDLAEVAEKLGVSEETLRNTLPKPGR
ncbi:YHYH protein [Falsirhodobacter sp. alg1]|uniref:YHYH protein n=1 Tax=Falsirhodobacter sp. alg1 TaxID=1472418 RepID=UPI000693F7D5|nr:YHYH protein [Falsirhodobacter sp. alg1]